MKKLYIAEKPSVAKEFANALQIGASGKNGYIESGDTIITWCVGHLITMSYPEKYDIKYKRWSLDTLPFLPEIFQYEVIEGVKKQYQIVSRLLNREDVDTIYICTDSGREGEYIYRLVDSMAEVGDKTRKRVWIDSQTEEEIIRGIKEAKDWSAYDNLGNSAYLRAKEDYLMGINFSRLLTLKYGNAVASFLGEKRAVLSVGRVMTCVVGMVVRREREIRNFVKTPFYKVAAECFKEGQRFSSEWKVTKKSVYFESLKLYKDNGFKAEEDAKELIDRLEQYLKNAESRSGTVESIQRKKELKYAPLLYNLAELQNDCSKKFKINPDETLKAAQSMYEKKLITYPRTDARVLSTAVAKEISRNLGGLKNHPDLGGYAAKILSAGGGGNILKGRYVNDQKITDHYAIIPTGQTGAWNALNALEKKIYELICRRFLSIFYPPAEYMKYSLVIEIEKESFFANFKLLKEEGYLQVALVHKDKEKKSEDKSGLSGADSSEGEDGDNETDVSSLEFIRMLESLKKKEKISLGELKIKEGESSPPKRYTSGSIILAMENAGQLIEDEELRSQIKGSGIGTSATRAEILKKLFHIKYLKLNHKTQIIAPTLFGEVLYEVVNSSITQLLNPELTASWEKGLTYVAEGSISPEEYMEKLEKFVALRTANVLKLKNQYQLKTLFEGLREFYTAASEYRSLTK